MEPSELRRKVGAILAEEERAEADWGRVARLSEELDAELAATRYSDCPEVVRHYLSDDDIRTRDEEYARQQRERLRRYIETGEYHDSKPVPLWGCVLVLAVPAAVLSWLLI
jgi:hypothetical protein